MRTIKELCKYLENECYQFRGIGIENHQTQDGVIIERNANSYDFSSMERGVKTIVKSFDTEELLVQYAYEILTANEDYRAHLVAWVWSEDSVLAAEDELKRKGIRYKRNDIPNFREGKTAYRIFVFGKDVLKVDSLKKKYWEM